MAAVERTTDEDDKYFTEEEEILWPANPCTWGFYRKGVRHRVPSSSINSTDHPVAYPITFCDNHGYFRVHFDRAEMFGQIVHIDGDSS